MKEGKMQKAIKQHYVPRCYLKRWGNEKGQLFVYDKRAKKSWTSNIVDVACERFFYDINHTELSLNSLKLLTENGVNPEDDEQFIEHFFSSQVEEEYSTILEKILDKNITLWHENNCVFVNSEEKFKLSIFLTYQLIRTKTVRRNIKETSDCMEQILKDMSIPSEAIEKYKLRADDDAIIQGNMFFDIDQILDLTKDFFNLTWMLGINKTNTSLYTSDNPIGTFPHVKADFIQMSGIASPGVEVYMPLSPKHVLMMFDANYHTCFEGKDKRYVPITDEQIIDRYNSLCVLNSGQYVLSKDSEFCIIKRMIEKDPKVLDYPKAALSFGGKTYYPNN